MQEVTSSHNFCGLEKPYFSKENSHFFILPIPYEATTTYMPGTRFGPQAIIDASINMELYDEELHQETYKTGICTLPYIEPVTSGPEYMINKLDEYTSKLIEDDKIVISLGGEHTISVGLVRAFQKIYPKLSVLFLDAHADLRDKYQLNPYSHACTARRIKEIAPIVLGGTRSLSAEEAVFIEKTDQVVFWGKEGLTAPGRINSQLSDTVYISLDVDIMDPSIMPSTGTPEPDGWTWHELAGFLKEVISNKKIVGIDIVELSPIKNNPAPDFSVAKLIYRIIGYITKCTPQYSVHTKRKGVGHDNTFSS